ncbi:hypothetical protein B0H63DRAFT_463695 [Podospora didyma]|uniref:Uncharacterized protein n=1 Tax=Podospora didyma TaxID=330526 RepID=A0AAE0NXD0_9PEZI|nr:hypothetical protein B0H63DRAFT_463695 [Podospora didyma]
MNEENHEKHIAAVNQAVQELSYHKDSFDLVARVNSVLNGKPTNDPLRVGAFDIIDNIYMGLLNKKSKKPNDFVTATRKLAKPGNPIARSDLKPEQIAHSFEAHVYRWLVAVNQTGVQMSSALKAIDRGRAGMIFADMERLDNLNAPNALSNDDDDNDDEAIADSLLWTSIAEYDVYKRRDRARNNQPDLHTGQISDAQMIQTVLQVEHDMLNFDGEASGAKVAKDHTMKLTICQRHLLAYEMVAKATRAQEGIINIPSYCSDYKSLGGWQPFANLDDRIKMFGELIKDHKTAVKSAMECNKATRLVSNPVAELKRKTMNKKGNGNKKVLLALATQKRAAPEPEAADQGLEAAQQEGPRRKRRRQNPVQARAQPSPPGPRPVSQMPAGPMPVLHRPVRHGPYPPMAPNMGQSQRRENIDPTLIDFNQINGQDSGPDNGQRFDHLNDQGYDHLNAERYGYLQI